MFLEAMTEYATALAIIGTIAYCTMYLMDYIAPQQRGFPYSDPA